MKNRESSLKYIQTEPKEKIKINRNNILLLASLKVKF